MATRRKPAPTTTMPGATSTPVEHVRKRRRAGRGPNSILSRPHLRLVRSDERPTRRQRTHERRALRRERRAARDPMPRAVVLLLSSAFLLTAIGLVMVLSASSVSSFQSNGDSFLYLKRQAIYAVIGTAILLVTVRVSYRRWERWALPLLVAAVVLMALALVPGIGSMRGGSFRWIVLGPVTIQPSELAKLAMVVFVAMILTRKWRRLDEPLHLAIPLVPVVLLACGLIIKQRDLGTTTIVAVTAFVLVFAAGVRLRYLFLAGAAAAAAGWALIMVEGYRKDRLLSFLHPNADPQNTGYQLLQSLLGLGSGGLFGVGLGASRQKWMYVPNAHTDFIFSILGEELGLIGELVVLALFVALLYSGMRIASRVNDTFGRLLATGIVAWLALQTLINLGAVTGVLPVTGVPLPFVSFGGSSLIVTLAAVGILANIGRTAAAERAEAGEEADERRHGRRARRREMRGSTRLEARHARRPSPAAAAHGRPGRSPSRRSSKSKRGPTRASPVPGSPGASETAERAATRGRHPAGAVRRTGAAPRPAVHRAEPPPRTAGARRPSWRRGLSSGRRRAPTPGDRGGRR